jgi:hypothetical protein
MAITVLKKGGSIEEFDSQKIVSVLIAAGLDKDKAASISREISDWAQTQESPISHCLIRDQVTAILQKTDPYVAGLFNWYQQSKYNHQ